ncbi:hypothetical protein D083_1222 [Dickeya solani RNS 08.23.3.1.A]|nr:hypothetical protein D083_1222 [Dickeya solani RNS 08.23.3.1.A]
MRDWQYDGYKFTRSLILDNNKINQKRFLINISKLINGN